MNKDYKEVTECRCCGGTDLTMYLDLGNQPPANSYHDLGESLKEFPLQALICSNCYHSMLSIVVNPDDLFKNYAYVSGTSQTLQDYFKWFAEMVKSLVDRFNPGAQDLKVMDIACNDGTQLDYFLQSGWNTYGVDPAQNLWATSQLKGHKVICDYWTPQVAKRFNRKYEALIAQNVFAHTDDIVSFLLACKEGMHDKSMLFIQTSQCDMFLNNEFDTMYHEHLSFFNVNSMKTVCDRVGLHLSQVFKTTIHGNSYVFVITANPGLIPESNIDLAIQAERSLGLYNLASYTDFAKNAKRIVEDLKNKVDELQKEDYCIIGIGAAAKGMTVLNFGKIQLDSILDENPLKIGKYTPGMNIKIRSLDGSQIVPVVDGKTALVKEMWYHLSEQKVAWIPLAWNFYDELRKKVESYRTYGLGKDNDVFIKYFPKLEVTK